MDDPVIRYHGTRHPTELGETEIIAFLTRLAAEQRVSRSTQMQALSALLLLYREVLGTPVGDLRRVLRSTSPTRLPAVLSRGEVRTLLGRRPQLIAGPLGRAQASLANHVQRMYIDRWLIFGLNGTRPRPEATSGSMVSASRKPRPYSLTTMPLSFQIRIIHTTKTDFY